MCDNELMTKLVEFAGANARFDKRSDVIQHFCCQLAGFSDAFDLFGVFDGNNSHCDRVYAENGFKALLYATRKKKDENTFDMMLGIRNVSCYNFELGKLSIKNGKVAEWSNAPDSKSGIR